MTSDARFEDLFKRFYGRVVAYLIHLGHTREDARDLAQDTFVRVYRHMDAYRGDAEWGFLKTTANRLSSNDRRDKGALKRKGQEVAVDAAPELTDHAPPADEKLAVREATKDFQERLVSAIAALPEGTRNAFLLRLRGYSYQEIAAKLHVSMDAVKSRLYDAKHRLRKALGEEPQGIDWAEAAGENSDDG